jgi:glycosyltransferase involved in cell wall biosynthesis
VTRPHRVAFLSPVGVVGGAERILLHSVRGLRDHFPSVEMHAVLAGPGELADRLRALGVEVHLLPFPETVSRLGDTKLRNGGLRKFGRFAVNTATAGPIALSYAQKLRRLLARLRPEIVHSNGLKMHLLSAATCPREARLVWHLHDFYSERPIAARMLELASRRASVGIAVSQAVLADAQRVMPRSPLVAVLNSVDLDEFQPQGDTVDLDALASLPPAPSSVLRVGLVATYANWKGHDVFLKALAQIPASIPMRGYIVGGPIYATAGSQVSRASLESDVRALGLDGRVGLVGFQRNVAAVYRSLDVVVHASKRPEPFGLTVAEAMSAGRAVVVAAAGGAQELFTEGWDGLGHVPGDSSSLRDSIVKLATDANLARRLGTNARATAEQRFGLPRYGREIADAYRNAFRSRQ